MKNDPKKPIIDVFNIERFYKYVYKLFDKKHISGFDIEKTFYTYKECPKELFDALDRPPDAHGKICCLIGKNYLDLTETHVLIAGKTRSGKTNFLNEIILSLGHWHHPEYLKIMAIDAKGGVLGDWRDVISYVPNDPKKIETALRTIYAELEKRLKKVQEEKTPNDAKSMNEFVYKFRKKEQLMPFYVIIVDEFQNIIEYEREKRNLPMDEEKLEDVAKMAERKGEKLPLLSIINRLAAQGAGLGISLIFATQAPYAKYLEGSIKNNFEERICLKMGGQEQAKLVLGKKAESDLEPMDLSIGQFLHRKNGRRNLHSSHLVPDKTIKVACENWKKGGFNFKIRF